MLLLYEEVPLRTAGLLNSATWTSREKNALHLAYMGKVANKLIPAASGAEGAVDRWFQYNGTAHHHILCSIWLHSLGVPGDHCLQRVELVDGGLDGAAPVDGSLHAQVHGQVCRRRLGFADVRQRGPVALVVTSQPPQEQLHEVHKAALQ